MKLTSGKMAPGAKAGVNGRTAAGRENRSAFTLLELAVVLCLIAVLMALMIPALAATKPGGGMAQCLNNQRQLTVAWQMYAEDNADTLMGTTWISSSSYMDWTSSPANTNTAILADPADSKIALYNRSVTIYKCPADHYQSAANPGPRVRSVSCNLALGGAPVFENQTGRTYISARKIMDLTKPGPAATFVFIDENPDSINDGLFALNPGYAKGQERWRNLPASYHNGAAGISFADGHADMHQWQVTSGILPTTTPVAYDSAVAATWSNINLGANLDYEWLDDHMPFR